MFSMKGKTWNGAICFQQHTVSYLDIHTWVLARVTGVSVNERAACHVFQSTEVALCRLGLG